LVQLQAEKQNAVDRAAELEAKLAGLEQDLKSRDDELQKLATQNLELTTQLNDATSEIQQSVVIHEQETQALRVTLKPLQDQVQELDRLNSQKDETINGHTSDIEALRSDLERAYAELDDERKELGAQIDELRIAGQVGSMHSSGGDCPNPFAHRKQSPSTRNICPVLKASNMNLSSVLQPLRLGYELRPMMLVCRSRLLSRLRPLQLRLITKHFVNKFSTCRRSPQNSRNNLTTREPLWNVMCRLIRRKWGEFE
jgi:hypothetical protein